MSRAVPFDTFSRRTLARKKKENVLRPIRNFVLCTYQSKRIAEGRAIAQAVSRRLLNSEPRFRVQLNPCGICGGRNGTGVGLSPRPSVSVMLGDVATLTWQQKGMFLQSRGMRQWRRHRYCREHEVDETRKTATSSELSRQRGNIAVTFYYGRVKSVAL
jgi:hypothetical protein